MRVFKDYYVQLLAILLIVLSIFSCSEDNLTNDLSENQVDKMVVSVDLAKKVALNFTKDEVFIGKPQREDLKIALRSIKKTKAFPFPELKKRKVNNIIELNGNSGKTSLYVINFSPSGYVIVPSTKKEVPILAFSNNSTFDKDNILQGIQNWIDHRSKIVEFLKNNNVEASKNVKEQWDCVAPPEDEEEIVSGEYIHEQKGPLLQTRWGQNYGYNELVRFNNCTSGTSPTGCVATAMAQVMRYHEYPSYYNWSIMPNQIVSTDPLNSATHEVARLMEDVGESVDMNYSCSGSGAYTSEARNALVNTFGTLTLQVIMTLT